MSEIKLELEILIDTLLDQLQDLSAAEASRVAADAVDRLRDYL